MLESTADEQRRVLDYLAKEAPDLTVELLQRVYTEQVVGIQHDIWDVHTDDREDDRWWVITNPTNLYSQKSFPNMDLALTFHVGLCIRIPREHSRPISSLEVEPLTASWRQLSSAHDALRQATEVEDFQAIGMMCRESLITLAHNASAVVNPPEAGELPKKSDFPAWSERIAETIFPGASNEARRALLKRVAGAVWKFASWLTHARRATLQDAEAATGAAELTLALYTEAWVRHDRGVPDKCPECGSAHLKARRWVGDEQAELLMEQPHCVVCNWAGASVTVRRPLEAKERRAPEGDCVIPEEPLVGKKRP